MASGRVFTANVVLARQRGGETEQFSIGDEVPEWALDMVGDHASQGTTRAADAPEPETPVTTAPVTPEAPAEPVTPDEVDEDDTYESWTKDQLKEEAKAREIAGVSKLSKEELVAALEAFDEEDGE